MSANKKIVGIMLFSTLATVTLAMEKELSTSQEKGLTKSQNIKINNGTSSQSYSSYVSSLSNGLSYMSDCVVSSLDSLSNTITNQISDEAAFRKLGWPLFENDDIARQELEKSSSLYKRHNECFKGYDEYFEYAEDCAAINRRTQYCQRLILALYKGTITNHADRPKLALHCLTHHKDALNNFDKSKLLFFIEQDQIKIKQETKEVDQKLKNLTIVSEDNETLNNFLKQQEEDKKRVEEKRKLEEQKRLEEKEKKEQELKLLQQKQLEQQKAQNVKK